MNNPKSGLVEVLKGKLDVLRGEHVRLSKRFVVVRRENRLLRDRIKTLEGRA